MRIPKPPDIPPSAILPETLYPEIIEEMLTQGLDFLQAALRLGHPLTPDEAYAHSRKWEFKEMYKIAHRKFNEVAASPAEHTKNILTGKMLHLATQLTKGGRLKEAADVLANVGKLSGWVGAETTINLFDSLSGSDLNELRETLAKRAAGTKPN